MKQFFLSIYAWLLYVAPGLTIRNSALPTQCIYWFCMILTVNSINELIFLMVKCCVFFEIRTEFLNIS
jgi:hypothetical protein